MGETQKLHLARHGFCKGVGQSWHHSPQSAPSQKWREHRAALSAHDFRIRHEWSGLDNRFLWRWHIAGPEWCYHPAAGRKAYRNGGWACGHRVSARQVTSFVSYLPPIMQTWERAREDTPIGVGTKLKSQANTFVETVAMS